MAHTSTSGVHLRHSSASDAAWQSSADVIAREGSELASQLRARGWVARAGWRARHGGWLLRFSPPAAAEQRTNPSTNMPDPAQTPRLMERQELAIAC